jgi:hypothetical protein
VELVARLSDHVHLRQLGQQGQLGQQALTQVVPIQVVGQQEVVRVVDVRTDQKVEKVEKVLGKVQQRVQGTVASAQLSPNRQWEQPSCSIAEVT